MRTIFLSIIFLFTSIIYSQVSVELYPIISVDSLNNKIVIFTIEQARKIDTELEILELMKMSEVNYQNIDSLYIKVINEKNEVIRIIEEKNSLLGERIESKEMEIKNLKEQILRYQMLNDSYTETIDLKDREINLHKDKIKSQRNRMIIGGTLGSASIIGLIIAILLIVK